MQNIPFNRISREQIPGAPQWLDGLIYPLNSDLIVLYSGLNKNITITENLDTESKSFTITGGAADTDNTFTFVTKKRFGDDSFLLIPKVIVNDGSGAFFANPDYTATSTQQGISITSISGLTTGVSYTIKIIIFYK